MKIAELISLSMFFIDKEFNNIFEIYNFLPPDFKRNIYNLKQKFQY